MVELASSPGRVVGDARGRWGVGAVPNPGRTRTNPELAAALHVFGAPAATAAAGSGPAVETAIVPVTVLVEAAPETAGVLQLLNGGEGAPFPSPAANAIVLSSGSWRAGDTIKAPPSLESSCQPGQLNPGRPRGRNESDCRVRGLWLLPLFLLVCSALCGKALALSSSLP